MLMSTYAQKQSNEEYRIIFSLDSSDVDLGIANNRTVMNNLLEEMEDLYRDTTKIVTKISIDSYTSPEGGVAYNKKLSEDRSHSFYNYISERTGFSSSLYDIKGTGIYWKLLIDLVEQSEMDYKSEVLDILKNTPEETWKKQPGDSWKTLVDSRNKQLMDLRGGAPYRYLVEHYYPQMRVGSAINLYFEPKEPKVDTVYMSTVDTIYNERVEKVQVHAPAPERVKSPLLAIKTNLLADIAAIPNIEAEIPIGDRFSANVEFARLWSCRDDNSRCWEIQNYGAEARYWFGDRSERSVLTGFFGGVYFSKSTFDFQLKEDQGIQGEIDYSVGLTGGYSMPLCNNFNLEFSVGVGYIDGTYTKYDVKENLAMESGNALYGRGSEENMSYIFPTKAKVSLVWVINTNKTKK